MYACHKYPWLHLRRQITQFWYDVLWYWTTNNRIGVESSHEVPHLICNIDVCFLLDVLLSLSSVHSSGQGIFLDHLPSLSNPILTLWKKQQFHEPLCLFFIAKHSPYDWWSLQGTHRRILLPFGGSILFLHHRCTKGRYALTRCGLQSKLLMAFEIAL